MMNIYVGNLSWATTREDLRSMFSPFGGTAPHPGPIAFVYSTKAGASGRHNRFLWLKRKKLPSPVGASGMTPTIEGSTGNRSSLCRDGYFFKTGLTSAKA